MARRAEVPKPVRSPSRAALVFMGIVAFIATAVSLAELLNSTSYIRTLMRRFSLPANKNWISAVQQDIAAAPLDGLTQDQLTAHRQIARIAADLAAGEIDAEEADAAMRQWSHMDANNGLSRWLAAWVAGETAASAGGDENAVRATAIEVLNETGAAARASTYERQELRRSIRVLEQRLNHRGLAVLFSSKQPESDLADALPALVDFTQRYSSADTPLRIETLIDVLGNALRDDPMPATALLLANMIERLSDVLARNTSTTSAPDDRWTSLADNSRGFRSELHAALGAADIEPLDRRPLSRFARSPLAETLAASLAVGMSLMVVLLCMARAALAAIYTARPPRGFERRNTNEEGPAPVGWKPLWIIAAGAMLPSLVAFGSLSAWFAGRGPTFQAWPFLVVFSTMAATLALTHAACHTMLSRPRQWHWLSGVFGLALSLYPLLPPVCTSHVERFAYRLREHGVLWPIVALILLLLVVVVVWKWRKHSSPAAIPARRWLAAGVTSGFVMALLGFQLSQAAGWRNHYSNLFMESSTHVAAFVGDDWLVNYFDRLPNAPPWGTPGPPPTRETP